VLLQFLVSHSTHRMAVFSKLFFVAVRHAGPHAIRNGLNPAYLPARITNHLLEYSRCF
jgi:hypothetical protein